MEPGTSSKSETDHHQTWKRHCDEEIDRLSDERHKWRHAAIDNLTESNIIYDRRGNSFTAAEATATANRNDNRYSEIYNEIENLWQALSPQQRKLHRNTRARLQYLCFRRDDNTDDERDL